MFSFFKKAQIVDSETSRNIRLCFEWALSNFDRDYFQNNTVLVLPSREYFPDRADNELAMAQALCRRILSYTGLSHWPFKLVAPQHFSARMPALLNLDTQSRNEEKADLSANTLGLPETALEISYASAMMKKPMDLVGSMSKSVAQHYLFQSQLTAPAGLANNFDANAEILAIYMGFGVIIANSAYTFRGSCAKCYDPRANRAAALSEDEAVYCLALFCHYKNIHSKDVLPSLKSYLRTSFKKARKQIHRELSFEGQGALPSKLTSPMTADHQ